MGKKNLRPVQCSNSLGQANGEPQSKDWPLEECPLGRKAQLWYPTMLVIVWKQSGAAAGGCGLTTLFPGENLKGTTRDTYKIVELFIHPSNIIELILNIKPLVDIVNITVNKASCSLGALTQQLRDKRQH